MTPHELQHIFDTQIRAAELFEVRQDEEAFQLNRTAVKGLLQALRDDFQGETLRRLLLAFRGLAVSAFVTERTSEGRTALATGWSYAGVGLRYWPDAPPLLAERAELEKLISKTGGMGPVSAAEDWSWPFND